MIRPEMSPKRELAQAWRGVRLAIVFPRSLSSKPDGKVRTATRYKIPMRRMVETMS
jgi:hypothetical protein